MRAGRGSAFFVAAVISVATSACAGPQPEPREIDQHVDGEFSAVAWGVDETVDFFECHRSEDGIMCDRICAANWYDHRICARDMRFEFGRISKPSSDVVKAKSQKEQGGSQ